jgi:hypothetical protein
MGCVTTGHRRRRRGAVSLARGYGPRRGAPAALVLARNGAYASWHSAGHCQAVGRPPLAERSVGRARPPNTPSDSARAGAPVIVGKPPFTAPPGGYALSWQAAGLDPRTAVSAGRGAARVVGSNRAAPAATRRAGEAAGGDQVLIAAGLSLATTLTCSVTPPPPTKHESDAGLPWPPRRSGARLLRPNPPAAGCARPSSPSAQA